MNFRKILLLLAFFILLLTTLLPQNIYILVSFSFLIILLLPYNKWWDSSAIGLIIFSIFYTLMAIMGGCIKSGFITMATLISPVAFYRLGYYLMDNYKQEIERYRLLFLIVVSFLLNTYILTIIDISIVGIVNEDRALLGTSTENALAATYYGLISSVGIGCIAACFSRSISILNRLLFFVIVFLSLLTVIHLVNRAGLIVFGTCLLLSILIFYWKKPVKLLLTLLSFLALTFALFRLGLVSDVIIQAYEHRGDIQGFEAMTAGGRTERWLIYLADLFQNPLGWKQDLYAHNLWLDMARVGGWFAFLPFTMVTIVCVKKLIFLFRYTNSSFTVVVLILNIAILLSSFIEPVLDASVLYFSLMMCFWGMISSLYKENILLYQSAVLQQPY